MYQSITKVGTVFTESVHSEQPTLKREQCGCLTIEELLQKQQKMMRCKVAVVWKTRRDKKS